MARLLIALVPLVALAFVASTYAEPAGYAAGIGKAGAPGAGYGVGVGGGYGAGLGAKGAGYGAGPGVGVAAGGAAIQAPVGYVGAKSGGFKGGYGR